MPADMDAIIMGALCDRLETLSVSPSLPIAYPNVTFPDAEDPTPDNYLRVTFLPNTSLRRSIEAGQGQHRGIFQVSVMWKAGEGMIDPLVVAGSVIEHFRDQTLFSSGVKITITGEPWAASPIDEPDRVQIPVTINYVATA